MAMRKAVLYARVSSKEQAQNYSLSAQLRILEEYAEKRGLQVVETFVESHSASTRAKRDRPIFLAMLEFVRKGGAQVIVAHKSDRGTRTPRETEELMASGIEVAYASGQPSISKDMTAAQRLQVRVQGGFDAYLSENLSEEVLKGLDEKVTQDGGWPSKAPLGYVNRREGKSAFIVPCPKRGPLVARLREEFATGAHSLESLTQLGRDLGLDSRAGAKLSVSMVERVIKGRAYHGETTWHGEVVQGKWPPLVTRENWHRCQMVLARNRRCYPGAERRLFAFSRLIRCGKCGSSVVGEHKKQRHGHEYVYYRCTQCKVGYIREEVLLTQAAAKLSELSLAPEMVAAIKAAALDVAEQIGVVQANDQVAAEAEIARLGARIRGASVRLVDGSLPRDEYGALVSEWREQQERLRAKVTQGEDKHDGWVDRLAIMLDVCRGVPGALAGLPAPMRRDVIGFFLTDFKLVDGVLESAWLPGWDVWGTRTQADRLRERVGDAVSGRSMTYLLGEDSNPLAPPGKPVSSAPGAESEGPWRNRDGSRTPVPILLPLPRVLPSWAELVAEYGRAA